MEKEKIVKVYMCGVAWQHEIGNTPVKVHPSSKCLELDHKCTSECGIVEVEVRLKRWVLKQDFSKYTSKRKRKDDKRASVPSNTKTDGKN
jgi:hypothetical protein